MSHFNPNPGQFVTISGKVSQKIGELKKWNAQFEPKIASKYSQSEPNVKWSRFSGNSKLFEEKPKLIFLRNDPSYRNKQKINDSNLIQLFNLIKLDNGSESRFDILGSAGFSSDVMMTHQSYCQELMSKNDHSEKIYIQGLAWDGLKINPDCPKINSEYKNFLSGHFWPFHRQKLL